MNRPKGFILCFFLIGVLLNACIEERTLRPFLLPELVNTPNYLVESFAYDSALFVLAEGGVLTRYADLQQNAFRVSEYPVLGSLDPDEVEVLYGSSNQRFWLLSDSVVMTFERDQLTAYRDTTSFYQPTRFYVDYCLSPQGELYRVDFYDEIWDQQSGSFLSDYFLAIHRFNPTNDGLWESMETGLSVNSNQLSTPNASFSDDGRMLILTNPSYLINDVNAETISATEISRESGFRTLSSYHWNEEISMIYGFTNSPSFFNPVTSLIALPFEGEVAEENFITSTCEPGRSVLGPVKVLLWTQDEVVLFVQYLTSELTEANDLVGFIYSYGLNGASCEVTPIVSDEVLLPYSNIVRDAALLGGDLYIATESGLLVYDIATESYDPYLKNLFIERTE